MVQAPLSALETLPRDLFWSLIEYAPSAAHHLRISSKFAQTRMGEYATQRGTFALVKKLRFSNEYKLREQVWQDVSLYVSTTNSKLFELKHKSNFHSAGNIKIKRSMPAIAYYMYEIKLKRDDFNEDFLQYLVTCVGKRIGALSLCDDEDDKFLAFASNQPGGMFFKELIFTSTEFLSASRDMLLKTIMDHNVDQVTILVRNVTFHNPVQFLIELASSIRSLCIYQQFRYQSPLFGVHFANWSTIILEMFSKRLEKLQIKNSDRGIFIYSTMVNSLIEKLPIMGKKVWFKTTSADYSHIPDIANGFMHNNHIIDVNLSDSALQIRHCERVEEPDVYQNI